MKIADVSIRRPVFAVMMISALIVFGIFSYPRIGVDLFPNVEFPVITVTVVYPGADPAAMESKVADPIEEAVNTMAGIKELRSVNLESVTQVLVQFDLSVSVDQAAQDVRDRVSAILRDLPAGIDPPVIEKFDVGASPIMSLAISGDLQPRELTRLAENVVKERIQRLPGVGAVELIGGREREIHVLVDPVKLAGVGYTVDDVSRALRGQNIELPAGRVEEGNYELTVKTKGEVSSVEDIANIIISGAGGAVIRIGAVASVEDGTEEARSWSSLDGQSALALVIRKQSGANTVAVAKAVRAEIEQMRPLVERDGASIAVPNDTSTYVEHSINDVQFDLLFGGVLAVVIILFFLGDFRATLISAVAIPSSVVATFAFIDFMGFSFNNMTMLALSLSIGILIDDAIVVVENIHRHLTMGKESARAASEGTDEIGLAVLATTASICAVFLPVAFMKGIIGRFFYQFGLTVSFAVAISALVSFTLTPMLASRLLRGGEEHKPNIVFRGILWFLDRLDSGYRWLLERALNHQLVTLVIAITILFGSCVLVTQIKNEFIPPEDRAQFQVNVETPTGTALAATQRYVEAIAADLRANAPAVVQTFVTVGGGAQGQVNVGQIQLNLSPAKSREFHQFDVMAWVRERYADIEDAKFTVVEVSAVDGGGFRDQAIQFNIRGRDFEVLRKAADDLIAELRKVDGLVDLDTTYRGGKPELAIEIDRDRAADLGVPVSVIATTIRALLAGDKVTDLKEGLDIYDVTLQLPPSEKSAFARLANLKVRSTTGQLVNLNQVVRVLRASGPSQIERQSRQRQITVLANLEDLPLGEAAQSVMASASSVVPDTLTTDFAGMAEIMEESFNYMAMALVLAIIFVYMLLAAQFNSFVHPFTIMLALPLSVVGAFGGLLLTGMTLNIFSMIGLIMLMGLVTKNGILLVDYTNTLRSRGMKTREALLAAGPVRLRPILMTSAAMIFGMLPVALVLSEGGEIRAPMAVVVIGGLITSTLLTLVVVPVVYSLLDRMVSSRLMRWMARQLFGGGPKLGGLGESDKSMRDATADQPRSGE
ncbi:MAG: efflux RND transporter permease subunit [Proteobacteria bacterium]|nr:efflux RND transporter permease subunit [Pseudomonadota bacterium]